MPEYKIWTMAVKKETVARKQFFIYFFEFCAQLIYKSDVQKQNALWAN